MKRTPGCAYSLLVFLVACGSSASGSSNQRPQTQVATPETTEAALSPSVASRPAEIRCGALTDPWLKEGDDYYLPIRFRINRYRITSESAAVLAAAGERVNAAGVTSMLVVTVAHPDVFNHFQNRGLNLPRRRQGVLARWFREETELTKFRCAAEERESAPARALRHVFRFPECQNLPPQRTHRCPG